MATRKSINQSNYDRKHCRTYGLKLNLATDADIIEKLSTVDSMQGYIKQLIRQDIARTCPGSAPDSDNDSVPKSFRDPFTDIISEAISTWNDKASSILSDERPYAIKDSVPDSEPKKQKTPKQILSMLKQYTDGYDGSMYELLNALTNEYMNN